MGTPEPVILETLGGYSRNADKWPGPRIVKIFVSSAYNEYQEERKQLLEIVGPELQSIYDDRQIEIELVDMLYGCSEIEADEPRILEDHLSEVKICHDTSRACFFLWLTSNDSYSCGPALPSSIDGTIISKLLTTCEALRIEDKLLQLWYPPPLEGNTYHLNPDRGWNLTTNRKDMYDERQSVIDILTKCIEEITKDCDPNNPDVIIYSDLLLSPMGRHAQFVLDILKTSNKQSGVLVVKKEREDNQNNELSKKCDILAQARLNKLHENFKNILPDENILHMISPHKDQEEAESSSQDSYMSDFRESIQKALERLIKSDLSEEPDCGKGRKKTIQEIFQEHLTHMTMFKNHLQRRQLDIPELVKLTEQIKNQMYSNYTSQVKHPPILIYGPHSSGKTTLLSHLYESCETLFNKPVLRIIRFSAATPRSVYNLELLRVVCQQISIILKIPEGYLPKDASFDPLYINNWFQSLLRRCEDMENEILLIFIDNIHKINPLECDIVTGLSWLPIVLPKNVFIVCTSSIPVEQLQFTQVQKEKYKTNGSYFQICKPTQIEDSDKCLDELENRFGHYAFSKLARYITCAEFGLTETELLELLMPTSNSYATISLQDGNFNFSTLCAVKRQMDSVIMDKYMSGKLTIVWHSAKISDAARRRYLSAQEPLRTAHHEVANLFFSQFEETEDTPSDASEAGEAKEDLKPEGEAEGTPFQSAKHSSAPFTQRHVEESWLHLLLAGDFTRLKDLTICNFDFLHAAVQTVTISYLRCILEHVRCYIIDRDIELVYNAVRKSSDILTRDHMQLGAQIISWLRPVLVESQGALSTLVTAAMAWCDGYTKPLLVPLNGWVQPPIAATVKILQVAGGARLLALAPTGQHLLLAPEKGDPQLMHIMSNSLVHTFKGHSGQVLCMAVTKESQFLLTGSEDTTIIVWDLQTLGIKMKIAEHIAAVLCLTCVVNHSLIVSGGEDSAIIITSLADGSLIMKIDHHRGPVSGIKATQDGDVLISCSQDGTVCAWSSETFQLLNTIYSLNRSPIHMMDLSDDSVFLVTVEGNNDIRVRTFITGTDLHTLPKQKSQVICLHVSHDSSRLVVGLGAGGALVFSLHSGRPQRALPPAQPGPLSALLLTDHDDFLFAAGGNRVTIYSFRTEDTLTNFRPMGYEADKKPGAESIVRMQREQGAILTPTCVAVSADGQLAASGCPRGEVRVWRMGAPGLVSTISAHTRSVNCVIFSPSNLMLLTASEDGTVRVWLLPDCTLTLTYKSHTTGVQAISMLQDSRRVCTGDSSGIIHLWLADSGILLQSWEYLCTNITVTNNMKFAICSNVGENSARIWSLSGEEERWSVCHPEPITCCAITVDSLYLITGSKDMSLKVWQVNGGKLAQVLVGHTDIVTCVAVSVSNKNQVVSGSWDNNLIVWDINTGSDLHLLSGHLGKVICVRVSGDGTIAVSGAEDKTLIVWETKRGLALTSLQLHTSLLRFEMATDCARIAVHLVDRGCLPIICLHNTPAVYVKLPTYSAPKEVDDLRPLAPKRPMKRLLKKEVSLDTYTWQKKYGHLQSSAMMAQVDERLKRRFSVSASMEEISKIQQEKNKEIGSQGLGPEQAALAQSQHFDQLEALWNKISPPRRRSHKSLSKQSSLIESRFDSSEEDHSGGEEQEHMVD